MKGFWASDSPVKGWVAHAAACAALVSCGARTEIGAPGGGSADASTPFVCHPGDPPAALTGELDVAVYQGLAADADRVYVLQDRAPLLWSVDVHDGARLDLYGQDFAGGFQASSPVPLLAASGGVYFDAPTGPDRVLWMSGTGGPAHTIASPGVTVFDWSATRGYRWKVGAGPSTVEAVALSDGSSEPFVMVGESDVALHVLATSRFLHMGLASTTTSAVVDRRIDLGDGSVHDEWPLTPEASALFTGPNAACVTRSSSISCLADDQSLPQELHATGDGLLPRYIDADWVYLGGWQADDSPYFTRVSLADGHEQVLSQGAYPVAVTEYGACVYAALVTIHADTTATSTLWRFSP